MLIGDSLSSVRKPRTRRPAFLDAAAPPPTGNWVLASDAWNDNGVWDDNQGW